MNLLLLLLPVFLSVLAGASPPILSKSLVSQIVPNNPAISSAFLIPYSSALLINASSPFPALRVPPSWSFSIGFSSTTFLPGSGGSQDLSYSAQLENGAPIPDWLSLASDSITFGGVTPGGSRGIQVLKIVVTASASSNVNTSDAFTLIVSSHDLSLTGPLLTRNVTANNPFSLVLDDWQGVQVDGTTPNLSASDANLSLSLDTSSLSWLSYDASSCILTGTPPASLTNAPLPTIPAFVRLTLPETTQFLVVATNLTLVVVPSLFADSNLPILQAPPGSKVNFALAPFITARGSSSSRLRRTVNPSTAPLANLNVSAEWDPQNATWLSFDQSKMMLGGTVPQGASGRVQVVFLARDEAEGTISRAQMRISISDAGGGDRQGTFPTDRALRKTGTKIKLAVGVVFGVAAAIILLACFLAICRQCCVAREHVDGAYVVDQTGFDNGISYKHSLEKDDYESPVVDTTYLAPSSTLHPPTSPGIGHTMTKAAFFDAVRARLGSDGSWRVRRNAGRNRNGSGMAVPANASGGGSTGGLSFFGSSKRTRKSKISKPMVMLSSSTSVRDGFADNRARGGISNLVNGTGAGPFNDNFTIFGGGNNSGMGNDVDGGQKNALPSVPPLRPIRPPIGRVLISSPGTAILAYDRSRSNSDPSHSSVHASTGTGTVEKRRSGSAPSLGTGTRSGTQSTFATGDSTRLTNAVGEIPFRRPGFDGRWETLAERSLREAASPLGQRSIGTVGAERGIGSPSANQSHGAFPPRALVKGTGTAGSRSHSPPDTTLTPPKAGMSSKQPTLPQKTAPAVFSPSGTPTGSSKASTPAKSSKSKASDKSSPLHVASKSSMSLLSGTPTKSVTERSIGAPSSYRKVFFGDKGSESDSSIEDAESAVITHIVNRSSSETPVVVSTSLKPGKPRLVAFTHEKTAAAGDHRPRRDISQKAVLQGGEDSDADAEMMMGLEYVRQLGGPDSYYESTDANTRPSTSDVSFASDLTRTPSAKYYASNDSNNSVAGRARILAPLVISSHRSRHRPAHSMASGHDSFVSLAERENEQARESRWMVESALPRFAFSAKEPFNFAVPLDRNHKHASALAGSALEAKQADGRALPEWLRFDKGGKAFWGVTPKVTKGEKGATLVTRVVVKIWDGEKGEVVGGCVVDVLGDND